MKLPNAIKYKVGVDDMQIMRVEIIRWGRTTDGDVPRQTLVANAHIRCEKSRERGRLVRIQASRQQKGTAPDHLITIYPRKTRSVTLE